MAAASATPGGELSAAAVGAGGTFATLTAETFPKEFPDKHSMKAAVDALQLGQNKEVRRAAAAAALRCSGTQMRGAAALFTCRGLGEWSVI